MSFAYPLALLLLLPPVAFFVWLRVFYGKSGLTLPGHWRRTIDGAMQPFMAGRVVSENALPLLFWAGLWTLLVLALARPVIGSDKPEDYGNVAGRVIALDLGAGMDIEGQRLLAYRIFDAAPHTPTALVLATSEAFDVVPFTTDRAQLERYLQVAAPEVMPMEGRAPGIAITHAEKVLSRAELVVGQLVVLTGGRAPAAIAAPGGKWLRALVVDSPSIDQWRAFADGAGARLVDETQVQSLIDQLDSEVSSALRDTNRPGDFVLAPWLLALAALLWLLFFRRVRTV